MCHQYVCPLYMECKECSWNAKNVRVVPGNEWLLVSTIVPQVDHATDFVQMVRENSVLLTISCWLQFLVERNENMTRVFKIQIKMCTISR